MTDFVRLDSLTKGECAVMFSLVLGSKLRSRTTSDIVTLQSYELQVGVPSPEFVSGRFAFDTGIWGNNIVVTPRGMRWFLAEYEPLPDTLDTNYMNQRIERLESELAECRERQGGAQ